MTVDERLDRLTARHEALTESVEMLTRDLHEMKSLVGDIAEGTARLLHVAEIHEKRISKLEG
jgi:archaellum component FlaC